MHYLNQKILAISAISMHSKCINRTFYLTLVVIDYEVAQISDIKYQISKHYNLIIILTYLM